MSTVKFLYPYLFGVLLASVLVWFVLCANLFKRLRTDHPQKFAEMGSPSLIMNNSLANNRAFLQFLVGQQYRPMGDPGLSALAGFMRIYMFTYLALFAFLVCGIFFGYAP